jgi:hypothetical protein
MEMEGLPGCIYNVTFLACGCLFQLRAPAAGDKNERTAVLNTRSWIRMMYVNCVAGLP